MLGMIPAHQTFEQGQNAVTPKGVQAVCPGRMDKCS